MEQFALDFMDYVQLAQSRLIEMHHLGIITSTEYENSYNSLDQSLRDIGVDTDDQEF